MKMKKYKGAFAEGRGGHRLREFQLVKQRSSLRGAPSTKKGGLRAEAPTNKEQASGGKERIFLEHQELPSGSSNQLYQYIILQLPYYG